MYGTCLVELSSRLDEDLRKVRDTYNKLKKEYDQVKEKLKFFEKVGVLFMGHAAVDSLYNLATLWTNQSELIGGVAGIFLCMIEYFMCVMQESSLDWSEVEEALVLVREKKSKGLESTPNG